VEVVSCARASGIELRAVVAVNPSSSADRNAKVYLENGENTNKDDKSYFAVSRHIRRKNVLRIGISIVGAIIVLGVVFAIQVSGQGVLGTKMLMHIHPQITVNVNGQPAIIPENVGIDNTLWKDHSLDKYGMQGMSPLHTHDNSGTLHVESSVNRDYTLGEFVNVWGGEDTGAKILKVTVDGKPIPDWKNHILKDKEKISFEISQQ
jgi:sulfur carrier protein ThiS